MISNLPVARSSGARILFFTGAPVTVLLLLWAHRLALAGSFRGLSPIFFILFTYFDYHAAMALLLVLVAAAFVPGSVDFRPLLRWFGDRPLTVAACSAIVLCACSVFVYRAHPLSMDEYAVLFQSKAFAAGHLTGRFPPGILDWLVPSGFQDVFLNVSHSTGRIASSYWPSFSLLLTPFTWLGIPWACNPVLSAFTILAIHRLALAIFDDRESAGLAVLLTLASPVFFADGISYYSMTAHLLANAVYALLLLDPTRNRALAAGLVGSVALTLHNPVPHMLFALPWLAWLLRRENGVRLAAWLTAGYLPLCLLLGVGWFAFSMHLVHGGMPSASQPASASVRHIASQFGLPTATVVFARGIALAKIWLWAVPGLCVLAGAGAWRWRRHPICRLLLASAATTFIGYMFVLADQGHGWGFRYFHSAWIALPILAAGAMKRPPAALSEGAFEDSDTRTYVVACALAALIGAVGVRALQIRDFMTDDLSQLPAYSGTTRHIVFIDTRFSFYGADLVQNDPWLRGNVVRMLSHGTAADAAMMRERFPTYHRVFADVHGTVWAPGRTPAATPAFIQR